MEVSGLSNFERSLNYVEIDFPTAKEILSDIDRYEALKCELYRRVIDMFCIVWKEGCGCFDVCKFSSVGKHNAPPLEKQPTVT